MPVGPTVFVEQLGEVTRPTGSIRGSPFSSFFAPEVNLPVGINRRQWPSRGPCPNQLTNIGLLHGVRVRPPLDLYDESYRVAMMTTTRKRIDAIVV